MSDNITLHKSDCALLLGGYQCTCGLYQRNSKTLPALAAEPTKPEPVAYFDLQKQVFFWAKPTQIDVPMTIALKPLPLYAAPPEDEALRRDAERYRWLRDNAAGFSGRTLDAITDAAIDAAMEEKR